jgi:hypothetical protein
MKCEPPGADVMVELNSIVVSGMAHATVVGSANQINILNAKNSEMPTAQSWYNCNEECLHLQQHFALKL